jgi:hypothetical protein
LDGIKKYNIEEAGDALPISPILDQWPATAFELNIFVDQIERHMMLT